MNITLDNIIFSLQKSGGISKVWFEIIKRLLKDNNFNPHFIEKANQNIFRNKISIPDSLFVNNVFNSIPIKIQRYLNPSQINGEGIFHSSYYRIVNNSNFANVTTVHDFTYEYYRKGLPKIIHKHQKENAIRRSNRVICVSKNTKKDLLKFFPDIKEERISVIYNGVDDSFYPMKNIDNINVHDLVGFSSKEYILYIGDRQSSYKNFNLTVKATAKANLPLVIVGKPFTREEVDYLNKNLGNTRYKLLSGIDNKLLNVLYNHAFCLLYPSLYEGFGIPLIEAQKAGCPVICSNYSSIPEVVGEGALVLNKITENEIVETIKQLQFKHSLREKLIKLGMDNSVKFSWDRCYNQTKQLYKEILEKNF